MNTKALVITTVALLTTATTFANTKRFCKYAKRQVNLSKEAINNNGKIHVPDSNQKKYFKGCRHDITWMQQTREALCHNTASVSDIEVPSHIFFVFDGAADFSARGGERIMDLANLDGSEGDDLRRGNMNGGGFFLRSLRDQNAIPRENMQVNYYSSSGLHTRMDLSSATGCMKEMDKYLDQIQSHNSAQPATKIISIGYSNGGVNATKFQNFLAKKSINRPADLTYTIDPIAKTASFLFAQNSKFRGKKHPKTKRFVNLYQNVDHGSLGKFKLRGKPVQGANENIHVTHENSPRSIYRDGAIAHLTLVRSTVVKNTFNCEIAKVSGNQEAVDSSCLENPFEQQ